MQILNEIRAILTARTLDSFIGLKESLWFDAKHQIREELAWVSQTPDPVGVWLP
jgi:hypothetical protein